MTVGKRLFDDERVAAVVGQWIRERSSFSSPLGRVKISSVLNDSANTPIGIGEARVNFLCGKLGELCAEFGFRKTESYNLSVLKPRVMEQSILTSSVLYHPVQLLLAVH